jgi:hypothetical protein
VEAEVEVVVNPVATSFQDLVSIRVRCMQRSFEGLAEGSAW